MPCLDSVSKEVSRSSGVSGRQRVRSVRVVGGFLDGLEMEFADELNCLIGARGTGKNTMLELVRYAQDELPPAGDMERQRIERLVKANLGDGAIEVTIGAHGPTEKSTPKPPTPERLFTGGDLVFYPDHVELCGVKIISDKGVGHSMAMLEALAAIDRRGRFVRLSAEQMVAKLRPDNGVNSITGCAATIRNNISKRLLKHLNTVCGPSDVLAHDNQGYYLSDRLTVRRSTANVPPHVPRDTQHNVPGDIPSDPGVKANVPGDTPRPPQPAAPLNPRQEWVLSELRSGVKLTRAQLEIEHRISSKTAKRDLGELAARGLIQFINRPTPGHYAVALKPKPATPA